MSGTDHAGESSLESRLFVTPSSAAWAVVNLEDGREFAGRISEIVMLGTTMLRIDVRRAGRSRIRIFSPSMALSLTLCSEAEARAVAALQPEDVIVGGDHEPF